MGFDLSAIESRKQAETGKFFPLKNPATGEPLLDEEGKPLEIKISGVDASRIKNAVEQRNKSRRQALAGTKPGDEPPDFNTWETKEKDLIDDLVTLTVDWTPNISLDGEPLPFSKENALKLYTRFPEIAEQMTLMATNRVNFMPASSKK
jgi:hypothetical protein